MGFFDVFTGKRKLDKPAADRLFAMSTAWVSLETEAGLKSTGKAGIVFQPLATADFNRIFVDMDEILQATGTENDTRIEKIDDAHGYRWMILSDTEFEDLVVGLNAVSTELQAGGYGERILCAVFSFRDEQGKSVYWIYNYKRGAFYPFAPAPGDSQRDTERELQLRAKIGAELPVEEELSRWFPLWEIPI